MDFASMQTLFVSVAAGLQYTVGLFLVTIVCAVPLGLVLAFLRMRKNPVIHWILEFYIWIMRGTPLLLQLFFVYFGLPFIKIGGHAIVLENFQAACVTFVLNYTAYFCEIFRGGILSVKPGQYEAAQVLGFSHLQTAIHVVIPQMMRVALPALTNETITLVKDTALVTAIGVTEVLYFAKAAVNRMVNATAYGVAAVFYLIMTTGLTWIFKRVEKKHDF